MSSLARRLPVWLAVGWALAAVYALAYAWLTVGAYTRINFRPQAVESGIALRDCRADPACAPRAADLVSAQENLLDRITTLVRGSAWLVLAVTVAVLLLVTLAAVTGRAPAAAKFAGAVWKLLAAVVLLLLLAYLFVLGSGSGLLSRTPDPARTVTFAVAFESPFLDAGTLYYLVWFVVMNAAAVVVLRQVARSARA